MSHYATDKQEKIFIRRRLEAVAGLVAVGFLLLTIRAVDLHYLQADELQAIAKRELTEFVIKEESDLMPYMTILDAERLGEKIREQPTLGDE